MTETQTKLLALRSYLHERGLQGVLLQRNSNFSWLTAGSSAAINIAATHGEASLLVTAEKAYVLTSNIEAPRLEGEQDLCSKGFEFFVNAWFEPPSAVDTLAKGLRLGSDGPVPGMLDVSGDLSRLRSRLLPVEQERIRGVARQCASAMAQAVFAVRPGQTEYEIASLLAEACLERGIEPIVNLIATDERIFNYRHPTFTGKKLARYAMLVLCGRSQGLVVSLTRLIHFGQLPVELTQKSEAVARVDAAMIAATRPGRTLGQVFEDTTAAYAAVGYPDEWKLHHQGGPAAYEPRESVAVPGSPDKVFAGQAYAWNPSITGAKSEDTVLVTEQGFEVLTEMPGWPSFELSAGGFQLRRPRILEI